MTKMEIIKFLKQNKKYLKEKFKVNKIGSFFIQNGKAISEYFFHNGNIIYNTHYFISEIVILNFLISLTFVF